MSIIVWIIYGGDFGEQGRGEESEKSLLTGSSAATGLLSGIRGAGRRSDMSKLSNE